MPVKAYTRVTFDMPIADYEKLKRLAMDHIASIEEILIDIVHTGLESYQECPLDHTPNVVTKKAVANVEKRKGLKTAETAEELFKELRK